VKYEELEGVVALHLCKSLGCLLKLRLIVCRIYNIIIPEIAKMFTRTSNPI
jgi:hypothetical protein